MDNSQKLGLVVIVGLVILGWFGYSYYQMNQKVEMLNIKVTDLNTLAVEQVNTELGGPMASSTDFIKAVYNADIQINQVFQTQQK